MRTMVFFVAPLLFALNAVAQFQPSGSEIERVEQIKSAASKGSASAQYQLAEEYARGRNLKWDESLARQWYFRAATGGVVEAQIKMGALNIRENLNESLRWYLMAANKGNSKAQFMVGTLYDQGPFWTTQKNNEDIIFKVGPDSGPGVARIQPNWAEAKKWYQKAAEQGDSSAMNNLGVLHYFGQGTKPDVVQAYNWMRRSAVRNHVVAKRNLKIAEAFMTPKQIEDGKKLVALER